MAYVLLLLLVNQIAQARSYDMATTAVQLIPLSAEPYRNGTVTTPIDSLSPDVDVITLWPEYLGIPFDDFAAGPDLSPSHPWAVRMRQLADTVAATGKPVLLELSLIRTGMVPKAVVDKGQLQVISAWAPVCYDFSQPAAAAIGQAYVNYAIWMARTFHPKYLVNFIEANLYYHDCGGQTAAWDALVAIQNRAYDAVKAVDSQIRVFPSIHIESLYGYAPDGWDPVQYKAITGLKRDLIGISSYPFGLRLASGRLASPYDLPADYLVRIRLKHPQETLAIAETGWNNSAISIGDQNLCIQDFPYSSERYAKDYLELVLASADYGQFEVVNWWSMADSIEAGVLDTCYTRESVPYANCAGDPWCQVINYIKDVTFEGSSELFSELVQKAFGSMGLKRYDGTERAPIMQLWRSKLQEPKTPAP